MRGRNASSRCVGAGCDGRLRRQACSHARRDVRSVRRSRVVLAPRPWRYVGWEQSRRQRGQKRPLPRGELEVSRKAIARGKPGCPGCTCQNRVRSSLPIAHGNAGAAGARLSLRPQSERGPTNSTTQAKITPWERERVSCTINGCRRLPTDRASARPRTGSGRRARHVRGSPPTKSASRRSSPAATSSACRP